MALIAHALTAIDRRWKVLVLLVWAGVCFSFLLTHSADIRLFNLADTDDNMRLMQVRDLLSGQDWYDLRQHRLNPPIGANIHWSRLVDLPIAGLILFFRFFYDNWDAERAAIAVEPLLPLLLLFFSAALTARRLIDPKAYPLVFVPLYFSMANNEMFAPERIDHHGWQLALLALSISAIADPRRLRGGVTLGISTGIALAIGLEMIVYLALLGAGAALFWVCEFAEAKRLRAYAVSLAVTTAVLAAAFVSYDNRSAVCDALSPVWLLDAIVGSGLLYAMTRVSPISRWGRLAFLAAGAVAFAIFHATLWPQCLHEFDAVSPEAQDLWMRHVREVWPLYQRDWRTVAAVAAIPVTGLGGWGLLIWFRRTDDDLLRRVVAAASPTLAATLLMLWQTRTAPAAQMTAAVGAAAAIWILVKLAWRSKSDLLALGGTLIAAVVGSGAAVPLALNWVPADPPNEGDFENIRADGDCWSAWAMRSVGTQPRGVVMTFLDLGPRLITITHHSAIAGPYHRNSDQIADVMKFWRGSADQAHALAQKYHANYVLSCPNSSITTIFTFETPDGFYAQLQGGQVPNWLSQIQLSPGSPFLMWRVIG